MTTALFGGLHGEHLGNLTGLTVWIIDSHSFCGIKFHYDRPIDGRDTLLLGRDTFGKGYSPDLKPREVRFGICGDVGEVIVSMDTEYQPRNGLWCFKVCAIGDGRGYREVCLSLKLLITSGSLGLYQRWAGGYVPPGVWAGNCRT